MNKQNPPLYALVPITDTEGLKEGVFYELYIPDFLGVTHWGKNKLEAGGKWRVDPPEGSFYLRPLPEGTVAVSEEDLLKISEWMNDVGREQNHYQIFKGVTLNVKLLLQLYKKGLKPVDALNDLSTIC